jgi:hypothetical protein
MVDPLAPRPPPAGVIPLNFLSESCRKRRQSYNPPHRQLKKPTENGLFLESTMQLRAFISRSDHQAYQFGALQTTASHPNTTSRKAQSLDYPVQTSCYTQSHSKQQCRRGRKSSAGALWMNRNKRGEERTRGREMSAPVMYELMLWWTHFMFISILLTQKFNKHLTCIIGI